MELDKKRQRWLACVAMLCGLGGILYGYDIGVISGALVFIEHSIHLTTLQIGLVVGSVFFGGLLGTLIASPVADYCGRRYAIMLACVLFAAGIGLILVATGFVALVVARLCLGMGIGVVAVAVPLYIAELMPAARRGRYVTFFQLFLTFGILLAYAVDLYFAPTGNWHAMFAVVLIPAVILFSAICVLPESPRWLLRQGLRKAALSVLQRTHSMEQAVKEINNINNSLQRNVVSWRDLLTTMRWGVLLVALAVAVLNQGTGINAILQYAPVMLKSAGLSSHSASMMGAVSIGMVQLVVTIIAVWIVDKVGRRPLMIVGTGGIFLVNIALMFLALQAPFSASSGWLALIGLMIFIVFYAIGPGVVVWLVISELFPTVVRSKGMALCLFFNSLTGSFLTTAFPVLQQYFGVAGVYALCACFSLCYVLVVIYGLPETKSKSLEQIAAQVR